MYRVEKSRVPCTTGSIVVSGLGGSCRIVVVVPVVIILLDGRKIGERK